SSTTGCTASPHRVTGLLIMVSIISGSGLPSRLTQSRNYSRFTLPPQVAPPWLSWLRREWRRLNTSPSTPAVSRSPKACAARRLLLGKRACHSSSVNLPLRLSQKLLNTKGLFRRLPKRTLLCLEEINHKTTQ